MELPYRCVQYGASKIVFDRAGNPVIKKGNEPRRVLNYRTNTMVDLPPDEYLECQDGTVGRSICADMSSLECNAFSDFCQSYVIKGARHCRSRGLRFKSGDSLNDCYREREELTNEIVQLRTALQARGQSSIGMGQMSMNDPETAQLRVVLQEKEAAFAQLQQENIKLVQALQKDTPNAIAQAANMTGDERGRVIQQMQGQILVLQKQLEAAEREKADRELAWKVEKKATEAMDLKVREQLTARIDALTKEKMQAEEQLRASHKAAIEQLLVERKRIEDELQSARGQIRAAQMTAAGMGGLDAGQLGLLQTCTDREVELEAQLKRATVGLAEAQAAMQQERAIILAEKSQAIKLIEEQMSQLDAGKKASESALVDVRTSLVSMTAERDAAEAQREILSDRLEGIDDKHSREIKAAADEIAQLKRTLAVVQAAQETVQQQLVQKTAELADIKDQLGATTEAMQATIAEKEQVERRFTEERQVLAGRLEGMQTRYAELERYQNETDPLFQAAKAEVESLRRQYTETFAKLQSLEETFTQTQADFEEEFGRWNEERRKLQRQEQVATEELNSTKATVTEIQGALEQYKREMAGVMGYLHSEILSDPQKAQIEKYIEAKAKAAATPYKAETAVLRRRVDKKSYQYVIKALQEVLDIVRAVHQQGSKKRRRGSARR